jgi:lycopene cyclase domain-containing protein
LNTHYIYFIILAASVAGPLALSFDKKVAFCTKWKFVFPAMIIPALLYIVWDIFFTTIGVWSFNEAYITGIKLYNLPIEEVLFFFIVPYCCVFIYECIDCYFPQLKNRASGELALKFTGIVLLIAGIVFYKKYYTSWTFIFNAVFIAFILLAKNYFKNFSATVFLVAYSIILIPFLIVNGFLTAIPVVLYNDAENLGLRIYTIPFEDVFYGMLLILMNIVIYEKLRSGQQQLHPATKINSL